MLFDYLLRLADNGLVLAQRLGEWVGKAPVLEEDIASTNVGLDLLGQARLWLAYACEIDRGDAAASARTEDRLAYFRDAGEFRNLLLVEQPNGNYADTIARQYLFDQWHVLLLAELTTSRDARIAAIAAKAVKEVRYHVERSADWVIRLGDGTAESHSRMQDAMDALWMYTGEMFAVDAAERALVDTRIAADAQPLQVPWLEAVRAVFAEATLAVPAGEWMQGTQARGGRQGRHTEHLSRLLAEMQILPRTYPGSDLVSVLAIVRGETRIAPSPHARKDDAVASVWRALGSVVDPEIPVVSIVELGIVRDVARANDEWVITLTPTYSGCPATRAIEADVRAAFAGVTSTPLRIVTALSPPWSTDWIAPEARRKLAETGIAPPGSGDRPANETRPLVFRRAAVKCPNCGSLRTQELARFGSTACKAQYRCQDCLEPFDYFKPH